MSEWSSTPLLFASSCAPLSFLPHRPLLTRVRLTARVFRTVPCATAAARQPPKSSPSTAPPPMPKFSPRLAQSSLSALTAYYRELCRTQPFIARRLLFSLVTIIASKLIGITVPFFYKRIIDVLSQHAATPAATTVRLAVSAILFHGMARLLASVSHELRSVVFSKAGQRVGRTITAASFQHIHSLEMAFHNGAHTGAITRILDRGSRSVLTIFRGLIFAFLPSLFELFLVCAVLFTRFSAWYVLIVVLTFAAFSAWTLHVNHKLGYARQEINLIENEASAKLTDSLLNVEAVKAFHNAPFELRRYDNVLERYERITIQNELNYATLNIGQGAIFTVGLTLVLIRAANAVVAGTATVGSVVMLAAMLQQLWVPLNFLGWQYREVKQSLIEMSNLFELLRRPPQIVDPPDATDLQVAGGEIVFDNVTFIYPEPDTSIAFTTKSSNISPSAEPNDEPNNQRRLALDGVSFRVPAGKSLALVGSSGSGKSTATRLLTRLYDLSGGRILIDGQDISKATIDSLRKVISIVPQDTALFNDTIAYNILYGRPSATDEEVIAAAKAASIHRVIMQTAQGYDTLVGERGVRFSGGERQRLSVARAFLKGSNIIVEDESTSALDTLTEMEVSKSLQKLGFNRTRIIVAHRLSTVMNVDQIVVLREGRKVEEGTFTDLVQKENGIFRDMWERQQKKEEEDAREEHEQWHERNGAAYNGGRNRGKRSGDLLHGEIPPRG